MNIPKNQTFNAINDTTNTTTTTTINNKNHDKSNNTITPIN